MNCSRPFTYLVDDNKSSIFKEIVMSEIKVNKTAKDVGRYNRYEDSDSVLNNMDHLNELMRKRTEENLFLGTKIYD